ncbi:MAG TPA: hybrid sensor histidine kinase/response regulator, partial [Bryobacteraceae bacterium]|nr:hybrid sensor histidine kinase/response regulator [Bryobacteraceae bacterium]
VVLPEMSGQELSEKLLALHPRLKVLFMSGYTDRSISLGTAAFIQKPFTPEALGRKIREVLEGR